MRNTECEEVQFELSLISPGEPWPPGKEERISEHLKKCRACQAFCTVAKEIDSLLQSTLLGAEDGVPDTEGSTQADTEESPEEKASSDSSVGRRRERGAGFRPSNSLSTGPRSAPQQARNKGVSGVYLKAAASVLILLHGMLLWQLTIGQVSQTRDENTMLMQMGAQKDATLQLASRVASQELDFVDLIYGPKQEKAMEAVSLAYLKTGQDEMSLRPTELLGTLSLVRGTALFSSGRYRAAERSFRTAADRFITARFRIVSLFGLGTVQKHLGRYEESIETYERVLRLTEGDPELAFYRSMALHYLGWGCYCLADAAAQRGEYEIAQDWIDKARKDYDLAMNIVPIYEKVRYNVAVLLMLEAKLPQNKDREDELRQQVSQVLREIEASLKQHLLAHPGDAKATFTLAMTYARLGEDDASLKHLAKAVELQPSLSVHLADEDAFKGLRSKRGYREILQRAACVSEDASPADLFFDTDFPMGTMKNER